MGIRVTISCRYCIAFEVMLLFSSRCMHFLIIIIQQRTVKLIFKTKTPRFKTETETETLELASHSVLRPRLES